MEISGILSLISLMAMFTAFSIDASATCNGTPVFASDCPEIPYNNMQMMCADLSNYLQALKITKGCEKCGYTISYPPGKS
ncbi:MAG: hypothetical protein H0X26_01840 [Alphaproteobacteria bacterium]|nr:hypothetical protein [Alphaproteobacteria bacterium]